MRRFPNPTLRYFVNLYLKERDGAACKACKVSGSEKELIIHHIDENPYNWDPENLELRCRSCNVPWKKPITTVPQAIIESECVSVDGGDAGAERVDLSQSSAELQINRDKEPQFRSAVQFYVFTEGGAGYRDVVNRFAEQIGIPPVTADRYLQKMTSAAGPLMIVKAGKGSSRVLQIRPEYWEREAAFTGGTTSKASLEELKTPKTPRMKEESVGVHHVE